MRKEEIGRSRILKSGMTSSPARTARFKVQAQDCYLFQLGIDLQHGPQSWRGCSHRFLYKSYHY